MEGLPEAMQAVLDGREIGSVFIEDRSVPVKLVSTTRRSTTRRDLANLFLRAGDGRFVPMSSIATLEERAIAPDLGREQSLRAITVSASLDDTLALREAMERMEALAGPLLPPGAQLVPLAEAATLDETSSGLALTFGFAVIVVFLVLAAQFESFTSSLILLVTVPFGLASAVFALALSGTSLNVYSQIGLVLLVGIMAKNGILVVEFANQLRDRGLGVREAAEEGREATAAAGGHDDGVDGARRAAPRARLRGGGGGAHRARLGHRRRARHRHAVHAVPDAGGVRAARRAVRTARGGGRAARAGACRGRRGRYRR